MEWEDPEVAKDMIAAIERLDKDVITVLAGELSKDEARYLVQSYYAQQDWRIAAAHRARELAKRGQPSAILSYQTRQWRYLEAQIHRVLGVYAERFRVGRWSMSICGIGPVITAGLIAHIDPHKAHTPSQTWKFAGLAPGQGRVAGKKLDYSPTLKQLAYHIGSCLIRFSNHPKQFYRDYYRARKEYETTRNEQLRYAEQAAKALKSKKWDTKKDAYAYLTKGMLPPGHIQARCRRWVAKLFLAHFTQAYRISEGLEVREPYAISYLGHKKVVSLPNPEVLAVE